MDEALAWISGFREFSVTGIPDSWHQIFLERQKQPTRVLRRVFVNDSFALRKVWTITS